jgi:hypothetical protein
LARSPRRGEHAQALQGFLILDHEALVQQLCVAHVLTREWLVRHRGQRLQAGAVIAM